MDENFVCQTPPKPVEQWIQQEETPEHCPPCLLQPLGDMYVGILEEAGEHERISALREVWKTKDALTIARELDKIKTEVGEPLKNKLLDLDCLTQSFKQSET